MYNHIHYYANEGIGYALYMPFNIDKLINDWIYLQRKMVHDIPDAFTRDEWAYLISFLGKSNLTKPISISFGSPVSESENLISILAKPRGTVSLWLPNNVSLLGPLMLILLSLSGNNILMKGGSRSKNLTGIFLDYALDNLPEGQLKNHLSNNIKLDFFEHSDDRNFTMASTAHVRILFGSTEAGNQIEHLDHSLNSQGFYFIDRQSEAWVDYKIVNDDVIDTIIKVFTVYGQAGCTSPKKIVLIKGNQKIALAFRDRLLNRWSKLESINPTQHVASENIMANQLFSAYGWDVKNTDNNKAVIPLGKDLTIPDTLTSLPITWGTLKDAIDQLPENIQTIGHAIVENDYNYYLESIAPVSIKRFVPLSQMHHFGPLWDGFSYWKNLFEEIEISL